MVYWHACFYLCIEWKVILCSYCTFQIYLIRWMVYYAVCTFVYVYATQKNERVCESHSSNFMFYLFILRGPWGALSPIPENNAIAVDSQVCHCYFNFFVTFFLFGNESHSFVLGLMLLIIASHLATAKLAMICRMR